MITILQFGEGNFLRAFFDWMVQKINESTGAQNEVFLVQPIPQGRVKEILQAGGKYHVLLRGYLNGEYREVIDKVEVIRDGVNPFEDYEKLLKAGRIPELKVVVSNTTEAGIFYKRMEKAENYPSMLTQVLYERFKAGLPPLYILPLELIDNNGDKLKECIVSYAKDWGYPGEFFKYLDECKFYNTLVDRIVPGFPEDVAEEVFKKIGERDPNLTSGEIFHLFVIQGDPSLLEILPFHKANLNVILTDNLRFYRERKVRILNGSHTSMVPVGLLNGIEYVRDFVEHPKFGKWVKELIHEEIVPALADNEETHKYADDVLERFRNPALKHSLRTIALNSISKVNTRLRPTLEDYYRKFKKLPQRLIEAIAHMAELYTCEEGVKELPKGSFKLSDFEELKGRDLRGIIESFFPGLDEALKREVLSSVEKIYKAWR